MAGQESASDVYLTDDANVAETLLDKAIAGCGADDVEEIRSLGTTLASWREEILVHHRTGASNGSSEGLNLCVKRIKRCGHGFKSTTGCECCSTPAVSPSPAGPGHHASGPALPSQTA